MMVQMDVVSTHNGSLPGPGLLKNKSSSSNGNGVVKAAGKVGGGQGQGGKAPRKLTKNEKRRQKNKQKKAAQQQQASEGAVAVDESMAESNGVAVDSWPPPADKEEASDVQVGVVYGVCVGAGGVMLSRLCGFVFTLRGGGNLHLRCVWSRGVWSLDLRVLFSIAPSLSPQGLALHSRLKYCLSCMPTGIGM